jgi:thiol-disulfide isomerase/thioredoxin
MSGVIPLIARLALAAVFAVAAGAKLTDRQGTRDAVVAFGAPPGAAASLALLIPLAELATAALLLPSATAVAGSIAALGLLAVFSGAIAVNLARGRAPECHCFGQLHSAPADARTLARNGVLAAVAVVALLGGGGDSAVGWIAGLHGAALVAAVAGVVLAAVIVAGAIAFISLLRSHGRVLLRLDRLEQALSAAGLDQLADEPASLEVLPARHGLAPGTPAPPFVTVDVTGAPVSLDDLLAPRRPVILVFASPNCEPCTELMPELAAWQREHVERLTVAVASDGTLADVRSKAEQFALRHALLDADSELHDAFHANGTPGAVLIGGDGAIASYVASGRDAIEDLLHEVIDAPGILVGERAPSLVLESLDGGALELGGGSGSDRLLLFWNPDCGFCRGMRDDLRGWESGVNGHGPELVVVSSGDPERTREDGFQSTVVLDPGFTAGEVFGAGGTPSAILIGADGRVAASLAVGAQAVLRLARARASITGVGA